MSTLSKTSLQNKISTTIVTNTERSITAVQVAEILSDLVDSAAFVLGGESTPAPGDYTLELTDAGKTVEVNSLTANTLTIPNNTNVAFAINTEIEIYQYSTGQITFVPDSGVTLRSYGSKFKSAGLYSVVKLRKRAEDEWVLSGDTAA